MSSNPGQMGAIFKLQHEEILLYFSGRSVQSYKAVDSSSFQRGVVSQTLKSPHMNCVMVTGHEGLDTALSNLM